MKILSWDVGIINLAYCLLDVNNETMEWKINDWGIINLTNRETLKCHTCGKNASCYTDIKEKPVEEQYYCKKHVPKDIVVPEFTSLFTEIPKGDKQDKCKWGDIDNNKECVKNSKYTSSDKCYCVVHTKNMYKKINENHKIKNIKKKSVGTLDIETLKVELIKKLEDRKDFLNVDLILIENQPSLKNPKMKAISSTLFDYFLIRGIFDKELYKTIVTKVKFMSPSNKLKIADDDDTKKLVKMKGDDSKSYKLTKSLGIKYCKELIEPYDNWIKFFDGYKKKDDLADCFLQGLYYVTNSLTK